MEAHDGAARCAAPASRANAELLETAGCGRLLVMRIVVNSDSRFKAPREAMDGAAWRCSIQYRHLISLSWSAFFDTGGDGGDLIAHPALRAMWLS
jgi:hypothetical protein